MNTRLHSGASHQFSLRFVLCCSIPRAMPDPLICRQNASKKCTSAQPDPQDFNAQWANSLKTCNEHSSSKRWGTCFRSALTHCTSCNNCTKYWVCGEYWGMPTSQLPHLTSYLDQGPYTDWSFTEICLWFTWNIRWGNGSKLPPAAPPPSLSCHVTHSSWKKLASPISFTSLKAPSSFSQHNTFTPVKCQIFTTAPSIPAWENAGADCEMQVRKQYEKACLIHSHFNFHALTPHHHPTSSKKPSVTIAPCLATGNGVSTLTHLSTRTLICKQVSSTQWSDFPAFSCHLPLKKNPKFIWTLKNTMWKHADPDRFLPVSAQSCTRSPSNDFPLMLQGGLKFVEYCSKHYIFTAAGLAISIFYFFIV